MGWPQEMIMDFWNWLRGVNAFKPNVTSNSTSTLPQDALYEYLQNSAGGATPIQMNVNGAVTPVLFQYICPPGRVALLNRLNIPLVDGSIRQDRFAGLGAALTNGILVQILDTDGTTELQDFGTQDGPIKTTGQWAALAGVDNMISAVAGDDGAPVRWTLSRATGDKIKLTAGQFFRVTVRDDLSSISDMRAQIQGKLEDA